MVRVCEKAILFVLDDVITFAIGDPDIPTPPHIMNKLVESANDPENHHYPESASLPELREAIAGWYKDRFDVSLDPDTEVLPLIGAKEGIAHIPFCFIEEGDILEVGSIKIDVIDLRGHSPAGLGFVFEGGIEKEGEKETIKAVICGDALFAGSIGRTDSEGGDHDLLIDNIRKKIFTLPDETLVLSGHGPSSTVGREKEFNPFF